MSCRDFLTFCSEFVRFGSRRVVGTETVFNPMPDAVRKEVRPPANRRHPGGRPTSGRFARACCQHDFWMFRPEGLSAASNCRRCAPERKSPAQAARRPLRRSARMDPSDPDEEPRARPRSPRSDGKETCALTMVPGRTPFPCPRFSLPERASRLPRRLASRTGIRPDGRKGGFL